MKKGKAAVVCCALGASVLALMTGHVSAAMCFGALAVAVLVFE